MNVSPSRRSRSMERLAVVVMDATRDPLRDPVRGDAVLLQRVAIADGHSRILRGLAVDRNAKRRPDLVLAAIPPADRTGLIVEHRKLRAQLGGELRREFRHAVLLHQREDACLRGREHRMDLEDRPALLLARDLLLAVAVHKNRERRSVSPDGRLDDVRQEPPVSRLVDVLELLARVLLVTREVEVAAMVDAFHFLETERSPEVELDVERGTRVVCQLFLFMLVETQPFRIDPEAAVPLHALRLPVFETLHRRRL